MEKKAADTHDRYASKQKWVRSAATNVAELTLEVSNIKLNNRLTAETNRQQQHKQHDLFLHSDNVVANIPRARERQQHIYRKS